MNAGLWNDIPYDVRKMCLCITIATVESHCLLMAASKRVLAVFLNLDVGRRRANLAMKLHATKCKPMFIWCHVVFLSTSRLISTNDIILEATHPS